LTPSARAIRIGAFLSLREAIMARAKHEHEVKTFAHGTRFLIKLIEYSLPGISGIADALFHFTRSVTGGYFWCPPMRNGRIDLSAVGLSISRAWSYIHSVNFSGGKSFRGPAAVWKVGKARRFTT
jgi:hypothetical protein